VRLLIYLTIIIIVSIIIHFFYIHAGPELKVNNPYRTSDNKNNNSCNMYSNSDNKNNVAIVIASARIINNSK